MRKRLVSLFLVFVLAALCLPTAMGSGSICFVGINDSVPLYLSADEAPYYKGSTLYVPYTVFQAGPGGIGVSYNVDKGSLVLFTRAKRLIYDLEAGTVTDEAQKVSNVNVVYRSGVLFIPASKAASHFGLTATMLSSSGGSQILRFTDGEQLMDNTTFVRKAETLISIILNQETVKTQESNTNQSSGAGKEDETAAGPATVYLALAGDAVSEQTLETLNTMKVYAAFFLTREQIEAYPELVCKIYAQGHQIGLTVPQGTEDYEMALRDANNALDQILFVKSVMALLPANVFETESYAVFHEQVGANRIEDVLGKADAPQLFVCRGEVNQVLQYLLQKKAYIPKLCETTYIPGASATR